MSGNESAAISLLRRAVELDATNKQRTSALACYKEGLHLLMEVIKTDNLDEAKKQRFRCKAKEYMSRAEELQRLIDASKKAGNFHEQIEVDNDSVGHSYESLFGHFLDSNVTHVHIEDPYLRAHHQIVNILRLCELLVKKCTCLRTIKVLTTPDPGHEGEQQQKLSDLCSELQRVRGIKMDLSFSDTLHDRQIKLDTGWLIKIGRGLDIYKAPKGRMVLGYYDLDLRPCLQTTVDIFHKHS